MSRKESILHILAFIGVVMIVRSFAINMIKIWRPVPTYEIASKLQEAHVDMCIDGVTYMKFTTHSAVSVKYTKQGRVERCERAK